MAYRKKFRLPGPFFKKINKMSTERFKTVFVSIQPPPLPYPLKKSIYGRVHYKSIYMITQILHACYEFDFSRQFYDIIYVLLLDVLNKNVHFNLSSLRNSKPTFSLSLSLSLWNMILILKTFTDSLSLVTILKGHEYH